MILPWRATFRVFAKPTAWPPFSIWSPPSPRFRLRQLQRQISYPRYFPTMSKDTIVVFGATGKQGGSVINSILSDPTAAGRFHVKAVTRDVAKDKAKALAAKGVEVVTGNLNDKESLRPLIKGAYGVFAVTNFWEIFSAEVEVQQGKNIADVCKDEGVQHLVWSSLLNINELTNGVLSKVYHFDGKAEVEEYIRSIGIPATFFLAGFYMSNVPGVSFRQLPDGKHALSMPIPDDAPVPLFAAEFDTGKFVKAIFLKRDTTLGKRIYGATKYSTPAEMVSTFQKVFPEAGKDARFNQLSHEAFKGIMASTGAPEIIQEEMLQNMRLMPEFGYYGGDALEPSISILNEPLTTWEEYIKQATAFTSLK